MIKGWYLYVQTHALHEHICDLDVQRWMSDIKDDAWDDGYPACWCDIVFSPNIIFESYHLHKSSGITISWAGQYIVLIWYSEKIKKQEYTCVLWWNPFGGWNDGL